MFSLLAEANIYYNDKILSCLLADVAKLNAVASKRYYTRRSYFTLNDPIMGMIVEDAREVNGENASVFSFSDTGLYESPLMVFSALIPILRQSSLGLRGGYLFRRNSFFLVSWARFFQVLRSLLLKSE